MQSENQVIGLSGSTVMVPESTKFSKQSYLESSSPSAFHPDKQLSFPLCACIPLLTNGIHAGGSFRNMAVLAPFSWHVWRSVSASSTQPVGDVCGA